MNLSEPLSQWISVGISDTQEAWLRQRKADTGLPISEIVRQGVDRAMSADPVTTNHRVNQMVATYIKEGTQHG